MFLACGVGRLHVAGMFHVLTHAFFKACLFLGLGLRHPRDGRRAGHAAAWAASKSKLPVTYRTFLIATLAIAGIPPLAGFFSKDAILASVFEAHGARQVLWAIGLFTAGLTAFYMFRARLADLRRRASAARPSRSTTCTSRRPR